MTYVLVDLLLCLRPLKCAVLRMVRRKESVSDATMYVSNVPVSGQIQEKSDQNEISERAKIPDRVLNGMPLENEDDLEDEDEKENDPKEKKKIKIDKTMTAIDVGGLKSFLAAESKVIKIFWLVLFLASTGILIWQLVKLVQHFIDAPIVSTYTITTASELSLPIIYLCPTFFVHKDFLNETPSAEETALRLKEEVGVIWEYIEFLAKGDLSQANQSIKFDSTTHMIPDPLKPFAKFHANQSIFANAHSATDYVDPEDFFKNATTSVDNLKYCEVNDLIWEKHNDCKNLTYDVFDPDYGKCHVIDVGTRNQTVSAQAIWMIYNIKSDYSPKNSPFTPIFNGVVLSVDRSLNVKGGMEKIFIPPMTYNRVDLSLQHQVFMSFDRPYVQKCTNQDDFDYEIFNVSYTKQSCAYDCVARSLKSKCDCLPPVDRRLINESILNETNRFCMADQLACIKENITGDQNTLNEIGDCRDQCNVPCDGLRYEIGTSSMDLYTLAFAPDKRPAVPDLAYIFVAFSHMEYTTFSQDDSRNVFDFISNIGGQVNLWLGANIMTLIQLPIAAVSFCIICGTRKAKKAAVVRRLTKIGL